MTAAAAAVATAAAEREAAAEAAAAPGAAEGRRMEEVEPDLGRSPAICHWIFA